MLAAWFLPFALLAPKQLTIVKPAFQAYEGGPSVAASSGFHTGETAFLSFSVGGYQTSQDQEVHITYRLDALDPQGVPLAETIKGEVKTQLSAEDKEWMPVVRQSFLIPPLALPGAYRVAIVVEDKLSGRDVKLELPFTVRGRQVEPSAALIARNFRFLRDEDGATVVEPAIYRPGDPVWVRFDITGYKLAEKNRINVSYGVSVIGPAGNTMYSQPEAAVEQGETFYPKKYIQGVFSLNLNDKVRAGVYTIVLSLRDQVGGQTVESKHEFTVQ